MADITVNANFTFRSAKMTFPLTTITVGSANERYISGMFSPATTDEAIPLGELDSTKLGWFYFKNLDATNFVTISIATGGSKEFLKLKAGEFTIGRFDDSITAPVAKSDTAACEVEYIIVED